MASAGGSGSSNTRQTFLYFGALTLLVYIGTPAGYLVDIQTSYMLKNQLHATASQVSTFRLLTAVPIYFAFLFGLIRDRWSPFGMRDRGYFVIFGLLTAVAFLGMAYAPITYNGLVAGLLFTMVIFRFVSAAQQGLLALVGQEDLMSGRLTVLWQIIWYLPYAGGAFASGYISNHLAPRSTFLLVGAFALGIAAIGLWKPHSIFGHAYDRPQARSTNFAAAVRGLVRHRAIYPPILMLFLWSFSPGSSTPLQFYLTNQLHLSDSVYSYFTGIWILAFLPPVMLYGFLCKRFPLSKLLWWGTVIGIPQMIFILFVHSAEMALIMAVPFGLVGGIITSAIYDLTMRSCPPGMHGTLMMLMEGANFLAQRGGDLLGAKIYSSSPTNGFLYCTIATTVVYALILPVIPMVPKALIATREGEANPALEAAELA